MDDPPVLSYHESLLRQSDIELLQGPYWLNDNLITFYFEYLTHEQHSNTEQHLLFVPPNVTQCIKIIPVGQCNEILDPLDFDRKHYIFFAFNDNERPQTAGGSHWSLLVFSRPDHTMYHYDSAQGSNHDQAQLFARKLFAYMRLRDGNFVERPSLQQRNGYDCGIYVVNNAHYLVEYVRKMGLHSVACDLHVCDVRMPYMEQNAKRMRSHLLALISDLRQLDNR